MEENQATTIQFSYQTKVNDMYRFYMRFSYQGIRGLINLIISAGAIVLLASGADGGYAFNKVLLILIACLFTVIQPIMLYYKAAKQVKLNKMFMQPLDYEVSAKGIRVSLKDEEMVLAWEDIYKIVETSKDFYFYMSFDRAHILPKAAYPDSVDKMRTLITEYAKGSVKIRK